MESFNQNNIKEHISTKNPKKATNYWKWLAFAVVGALVITQIFDINVNIEPRFGAAGLQVPEEKEQITTNPEEIVLPSDGTALPVSWGSLGKQMVTAGVIDAEKFEAIYTRRGGLSEYGKTLLYQETNDGLKITPQNAGEILNLLWAFGLANKNPILEEGPMQDPTYGGDASRFASTGGWTLAEGNVMDHYSKHPFVVLTSEQQELVERVSKNIYRPCCGNSVYFPDCNHGMAMLGLLELLAAQGASEEEVYTAALQVNSYWFPDTYLTLAKYFEGRGVVWSDVSAKEVLGSAYSSGAGYQKILAEVEPIQQRSGGGCGV